MEKRDTKSQREALCLQQSHMSTMKSKRNKRANTLSNGRENSEPIPTDLMIEILSRLPIKSVARCRCVSKLWRSIVTLPHFTELFFTRSSSHPHLLFAYKEKHEFVFLSSPQPQNPDNNSSPPVTAKHLSRIPFSGSSCFITGHVQGLVCLTVTQKGMSPVQIICNPSTGQSLTLPKIERIKFRRCYLGYDPIDNIFKVLSINTENLQHHVLTLGTQKKLRWRKIKDCIPHDSCLEGVCINGVLYYPASTERAHMIGCFNFRSEKFSFIKLETNLIKPVFMGALINYNGKLGLLISEESRHVYGASESIELIVIGDFEKQEWSRHIYVLPPMWKDLVGKIVLRFVGVIGSSEIVLSHPSQVIYYNIEKGTIVKVGIQGMEAFRSCNFSTFVDHVEDLKLLQAF